MSNPLFTIFHFNDVYSLQPGQKEPKAGAAYFCALLHRQRALVSHPLTLFSGDAFSPSLLSTQFNGENMILPLNTLGIDAACCGNHDFDFQLQHVEKLLKSTNFPWMLSNVYDKRTGKRMAEVEEYRVVVVNGVRVGIFSLAEAEWIDTLYPFYKEICQYVDFVQVANRMVHLLRKEERCEMVIALTHMMKYNDIKLAREVAGIDLILGGHDHLIVAQPIHHTFLVKSGCNFQHFTIIHVLNNNNHTFSFHTTLKSVHHQHQSIIPHPSLHTYITSIYQKFKTRQQMVACFTDKDLDLRFSTIRVTQSPYLEFLVSIYRHSTNSDCALMNSGNFRMDCVIKAGAIKFGTITSIITDHIVVKRVPGSTLIQALQNCVSMYPNYAGRYSAMSGITFTWDCRKEPGRRVLRDSVRINQEDIDEDRVYIVAMHSFTSLGGDGFQCFTNCEVVDKGPDPTTNLQLIQHLLKINPYLLDTFKTKYPHYYKEILHQGAKYLLLTLPSPKNVQMIGH